MRRTMLALLCAAALGTSAWAAQGLTEKDMKVLEKAPAVLQELASAPDKGIPRNLLEKAECVMVFPDVTKGAFIVGGEYGRGVATCRKTAGGELGPPAFFTVGGGSIGWQIGGEQTDFVLLVMDRNGMQNLMRNKVKLGVDASAAAGPVGRTAEASTDAQLGAQLLSWSRSQGAFIGASLEGASMSPDKDANQRLYGREVNAEDVLLNASVASPAAAQKFVQLAQSLIGGTAMASRTGSSYDDPSSQKTTQPGSAQTSARNTETQRPSTYATGSDRADSGRERLPSTASPLALIGLVGLLSLGVAVGLRRWEARR